jgi:hypothetical protein
VPLQVRLSQLAFLSFIKLKKSSNNLLYPSRVHFYQLLFRVQTEGTFVQFLRLLLVASLQCQTEVIKKSAKMKTIKNVQCPNCWGYQTYDEQNPNQQLCECKTSI